MPGVLQHSLVTTVRGNPAGFSASACKVFRLYQADEQGVLRAMPPAASAGTV
jgi:hypothetical protein